MATNEETNAAGTDTRPPMLVENDYESWKIRIHRYIPCGKPKWEAIWKSNQNGPTTSPEIVTDASTYSQVYADNIFNILKSDKHCKRDLKQCRTTYARIGKTQHRRKEECARGKKDDIYNSDEKTCLLRRVKEPKRKDGALRTFKDKSL
ncbi:hypothetical protein Tco_1344999 [Tanacetum coccineum]